MEPIVNKRIYKIPVNVNEEVKPLNLQYKTQKTYTMTTLFKLDTQFDLETIFPCFKIYNIDMNNYPKKTYKIAEISQVPTGCIVSCRWKDNCLGFNKIAFMQNKTKAFVDHIIFIISTGEKNISVKFWANGKIHMTGCKSLDDPKFIYKYICYYLCHNTSFDINDQKLVIGDKIKEYPPMLMTENVEDGYIKTFMNNKKFFLGREINKGNCKKAFIPLMLDPLSDPEAPSWIKLVCVHYEPLIRPGISIEFFKNKTQIINSNTQHSFCCVFFI